MRAVHSFPRVLAVAWIALVGGCRTPGATGPALPPAVPADAVARLRGADALLGAGLPEEADELAAAVAGRHPRLRAAQLLRLQAGIDLGLGLEARARHLDEDGDPFLAGVVESTARRRRARFEECAEPARSLGLGAVALEEGGLAEAGRRFSRVVALDPGSRAALVGLARVRAAQGRIGEAHELYLRGAWTAPEDAAAWHGLSGVADRRGDLRGALVAARAGWRREPGRAATAARLHAVARRTGAQTVYDVVGAELVARTGSGPLGPEGRAQALLDGGDLLARAGRQDAARAAWARARDAAVADEEIEARAPVVAEPPIGTFLAALVRGVRARYRHHAASGEAEAFDDYVDWVRGLFERETGVALEAPPQVRSWTLVGRLLDPTERSTDPLVRACARHGVLLVVGQRQGGPPEVLAGRIAERESARRVTVRGVEVEREVVWIDHVFVPGYLEWAGGGDLAGLALDRMLILDRAALAEWRGRVRRSRLAWEPRRDAILAQQALAAGPVDALDEPAEVAGRLALVAAHDLEGEVLRHEEGHLVDAEQRLPVLGHPLRNFTLALSRGFSAESIVAYLERNAQLTAIAEGPAPRAALATCCERLGRDDPHARGYAEIVEGFVERILDDPARFPAVDPRRVVVQQLHRLSAGEVRALAGELLDDWGLRDRAD